MSEFNLIKSVRDYEPKENKPKIDYTLFEVMVEGKETPVNVPTRIAKDFEDFISENNNFTRRQFRKVMRDFRAVREK